MNAEWLRFLPKQVRVRLDGRIGLQQAFGNGAWLFAEKGGRLLVGVLIGVWMTRYLGPASYGTLSYAVAIASFFGSFATVGLDATAVRDLVRSQAFDREILGSAFAIRTIGGIVALAASASAIVLLRPHDAEVQRLVWILAIAFPLQGFDSADLWFQSRLQSKYSATVRLTSLAVFSCVKIYFLFTNATLVAFAWAVAGEALLTSILFYFTFRKLAFHWSLMRFQLQRIKALFLESWPILLSSLAVMIYMRIDQVMLADIVGDREVGLYSAALRLSELWYAIPVIIVSSIAPSITSARSTSEALYYSRIRHLFLLLTRISIPIAILVSLLARPIIHLLYGAAFSSAAAILAIHIWSAIFVFMGVATGPWVINEGFQRFVLFQTLLGALTNVGLNLILIPRMGGSGAALATLGAQFVAAFVAVGIWKPARRLFQIQCFALLNFWRLKQ